MEIKFMKLPDEVTARFIGRLDTTTAPIAEQQLTDNASDAKKIVMDFTELEYISSAGLRVLLSWQKKMNHNGGTMEIHNPSEEVQEIFEVTGFSEILNIV